MAIFVALVIYAIVFVLANALKLAAITNFGPHPRHVFIRLFISLKHGVQMGVQSHFLQPRRHSLVPQIRQVYYAYGSSTQTNL